MPALSVDGTGTLEPATLDKSVMLKGEKMISGSHSQCQASLVRPRICPHCGAPLTPEDFLSARLTDPVVHALLDRFLSIECELQQIRRLLVEEVLP